MFEFFEGQKQKILVFLESFLEEKRRDFSAIDALGGDLCDRLYDFTKQGKMIRGGLVSLAAESEEATQAGAAMELIQTALLIHDDIMDKDPVRRGASSVYAQYAGVARSRGVKDAVHLGESLGICAGDVAYFLAFEILSMLHVALAQQRRIVALFAREISRVGIAQMQDVYLSAVDGPVEDENILKLYLYKTGRYTFSLPLMVGAILAGENDGTLKVLERVGDYLGIIFQIKDDELGLFGDESTLGKPVGSDVREGKKTLYYRRLFGGVSGEQAVKLHAIFGNADITAGDLAYVQNLAVACGARSAVTEMAEGYAGRVRELILSLNGSGDKYGRMLNTILDYSMARVA